MGFFGTRPGYSTTTEAALLTQLNNLAVTPGGQAIAKTNTGFANVTASGGSGGTPGGSDTQVQFNQAGAFGGNANLTFNYGTNLLTVGGSITATGTYNGLTITTTLGTLTIPNNASAALITSGNYSITFTATGVTTVTLPTSGTLLTTTGSIAGLTGTISSTVLGNSTVYIGTTAIALNRASASEALTGITSIDGSAATLTTARAIWGQNFDGSAAISGNLTSVGNITGGASSMTITAGTGNSRTMALQTTTSGGTATTALTLNADQSATFANTVNATTFVGALTGTASLATTAAGLSISGQTGLLTFTGLTSTNRAKTVRDAADTILELGGSYTPTGTWTSLTLVTPVLGTPSSGTLTSCTGLPAASVVAGTLGSGTFTTTRLNFTNNAIAASANAATVPITSSLSTVTNNSAATLTITMTTSSAVDGQFTVVRVLDSSAAAQTITWVNTENSNISAPTTSNGSTTLFLSVLFVFNGGSTKWRCIGYA